jgi:hypothetical protein
MTTPEDPWSIPLRGLSRQQGPDPSQRLLVRYLDSRAHQSEEGLGIAQQVVGLPSGDRMWQPGLGSSSLAGPSGEIPGPLAEFRRDIGEDRPDASRAAPAASPCSGRI